MENNSINQMNNSNLYYRNNIYGVNAVNAKNNNGTNNSGALYNGNAMYRANVMNNFNGVNVPNNMSGINQVYRNYGVGNVNSMNKLNKTVQNPIMQNQFNQNMMGQNQFTQRQDQLMHMPMNNLSSNQISTNNMNLNHMPMNNLNSNQMPETAQNNVKGYNENMIQGTPTLQPQTNVSIPQTMNVPQNLQAAQRVNNQIMNDDVLVYDGKIYNIDAMSLEELENLKNKVDEDKEKVLKEIKTMLERDPNLNPFRIEDFPYYNMINQMYNQNNQQRA